jgi:hypothetical protein
MRDKYQKMHVHDWYFVNVIDARVVGEFYIKSPQHSVLAFQGIEMSQVTKLA